MYPLTDPSCWISWEQKRASHKVLHTLLALIMRSCSIMRPSSWEPPQSGCVGPHYEELLSQGVVGWPSSTGELVNHVALIMGDHFSQVVCWPSSKGAAQSSGPHHGAILHQGVLALISWPSWRWSSQSSWPSWWRTAQSGFLNFMMTKFSFRSADTHGGKVVGYSRARITDYLFLIFITYQRDVVIA